MWFRRLIVKSAMDYGSFVSLKDGPVRAQDDRKASHASTRLAISKPTDWYRRNGAGLSASTPSVTDVAPRDRKWAMPAASMAREIPRPRKSGSTVRFEIQARGFPSGLCELGSKTA